MKKQKSAMSFDRRLNKHTHDARSRGISEKRSTCGAVLRSHRCGEWSETIRPWSRFERAVPWAQ